MVSSDGKQEAARARTLMLFVALNLLLDARWCRKAGARVRRVGHLNPSQVGSHARRVSSLSLSVVERWKARLSSLKYRKIGWIRIWGMGGGAVGGLGKIFLLHFSSLCTPLPPHCRKPIGPVAGPEEPQRPKTRSRSGPTCAEGQVKNMPASKHLEHLQTPANTQCLQLSKAHCEPNPSRAVAIKAIYLHYHFWH